MCSTAWVTLASLATSSAGAISESSAIYLKADANTRIYFQPFAGFRGTIQAAITFRACDIEAADNIPNGFNVNVTASGTGGTKRFSTATDFANITVV